MTDITLAPDSIVGDIAARLPGAAEVFRRAGISFCCGGKAGLAEAAAKAGIELPTLTAELQALIDRAGRDAPRRNAGDDRVYPVTLSRHPPRGTGLADRLGGPGGDGAWRS
ncbi:DUF542 domain-containing protein [Paracoccus sp. (in: a-proteobacteria)]|uniref:DUF542 domain-containing protein n=1 Tax=Paracoccus sp. TaxID=267 RepID=UPI002AFE975A|nr:DUF542 domain-containing protein [Paracoccus sp. (in: a-proteobacteria)]